MKTKTHPRSLAGAALTFAALALAALAPPVHAQQSITWYKVSGGGGTSTNGPYSITGTIGQHDAGGPMTNSTDSITGGFWALLSVVQTAGAPPLIIFLTTSNTAVVQWPSPSTGWVLQQNATVESASWATPVETLNDDTTNRFIIVAPPAGNRFYRLYRP
jgi:hypothetical protein